MFFSRTIKLAKKNIALYVFSLPVIIFLILFAYMPMYGIQIAFRNYTFAGGITGSPWVGLRWFEFFFNSPMFSTVMSNTIILNLYGLVAGFPIPIILAIMLHNTINRKFKRVVQTVSYMPFFISTVIVVGMMSAFFSIHAGFVNTIITWFGGSPVFFMGEPQYFRHMFVWSGVWQFMGWQSIIYLAALSAVNNELYEAAMIDGASVMRRIWHIDLPGILPTIMILLILRSGSIIHADFEKVFLMQNSLNLSVSEVMPTYIYKMGLIDMRFSFASAVGLFNNVINFGILILVNWVSKRYSEVSLW